MSFYDIVRKTIGVCCAVLVFGMTSGSTTINITSIEDLSQIPLEQARNARSVNVHGLAMEQDFFKKWSMTFGGHEFDSVSFANCTFADHNFYILDVVFTKNLVLAGCCLTSDDTMEILRGIDPYKIGNIDLSSNNLHENEEALAQSLEKYIYGQCVVTINLKGNKLSGNFRKSVPADSTVTFVFE